MRTMRNRFAILFLVISFAGGIIFAKSPKIYELNELPPNYAKTCEQVQSLRAKGQTVKADRIMKEYRKEHLEPIFHLKDSQSRVYRVRCSQGWRIDENGGGDSDSSYGASCDQKWQSKEILRWQWDYRNLEVPNTKLEEWQEMLAKYYFHCSASDRERGCRQEHHITEFVLRFKKSYFSKSLIRDCFDERYGIRDHILLTPSAELVSYKLARIGDKTSDQGSVTEENTDSADAEATGIPPLLFFDDAGDPVPFNKMLQNGPIVLNFTASYCTACEEELKLLKELHAKRKKTDAQLVVVDIDKKEKQELYMNKFRALMGNKPPARTQLLFDPYQKNYQKVNGDTEEKLPLTLLVDQDGRILRRINGFDRAGLEQLYKKLETLR